MQAYQAQEDITYEDIWKKHSAEESKPRVALHSPDPSRESRDIQRELAELRNMRNNFV